MSLPEPSSRPPSSPRFPTAFRNPLAIVIAVVVAFNVVVFGLDRLAGGPSGPRSSSFATAPDGVAAYAELLGRAGHGVERRRAAPAEAPLDPRATVIVLDAGSPSGADSRALRAFVAGGGRLVAGGRVEGSWLRRVLDGAPSWAGGGVNEAHLLVPTSDVGAAEVLRAGGEGYWERPHASLPVMGRGFKTVVSVLQAGEGRAVLVADAAVLHNRNLGQADNATFALAAAGPAARPVVFLESFHGFQSSGLAALPTSWRAALIGLLGAALVLLWAYGRRLGPPQDFQRSLAPARVGYVLALGSLLRRSADPQEATAPLREAGRARLSRRAGLPAEPSEGRLEAAAHSLGMPEDLAHALLQEARGPAGVIALARAHAWLYSSTTGGRSR
ncbi:MAG: DUF4350 domain-containing protein [Actinomycetota bacterium]|nr:DUF4350 domain-containing protein [Actinomycetota bacterium]